MNENKKLRGDLAATQAEMYLYLQEQAQKKKSEDNLKKITDISTFHSTDKLDLEKKNILHYFVASSQYYKMRKGSGNWNSFDDHNLIITYIQNDDIKVNYEKLKKDKNEKGEIYEETLLFHGTDQENVDDIFINNFDINRHPLRRSKVIRFRGACLIVKCKFFFRKWYTDEAFTCVTAQGHAMNMAKFSSSPKFCVATLPEIL